MNLIHDQHDHQSSKKVFRNQLIRHIHMPDPHLVAGGGGRWELTALYQSAFIVPETILFSFYMMRMRMGMGLVGDSSW